MSNYSECNRYWKEEKCAVVLQGLVDTIHSDGNKPYVGRDYIRQFMNVTVCRDVLPNYDAIHDLTKVMQDTIPKDTLLSALQSTDGHDDNKLINAAYKRGKWEHLKVLTTALAGLRQGQTK